MVDASNALIVTSVVDVAECFFVDDSAVTTDLHGLATVALLRRDELDAAVAVFVIVLYQSTNAETHWQAWSLLVNGFLG